MKRGKKRMRQLELPHTKPLDKCRDCIDPPSPGKRRCERCRVSHGKRERARRAERKRLRLCWYCGAPAEKGVTSCAAHRRARYLWPNASLKK